MARKEPQAGPGREFPGDENPQALPGGIVPNFDSGGDVGMILHGTNLGMSPTPIQVYLEGNLWI